MQHNQVNCDERQRILYVNASRMAWFKECLLIFSLYTLLFPEWFRSKNVWWYFQFRCYYFQIFPFHMLLIAEQFPEISLLYVTVSSYVQRMSGDMSVLYVTESRMVSFRERLVIFPVYTLQFREWLRSKNIWWYIQFICYLSQNGFVQRMPVYFPFIRYCFQNDFVQRMSGDISVLFVTESRMVSFKECLLIFPFIRFYFQNGFKRS